MKGKFNLNDFTKYNLEYDIYLTEEDYEIMDNVSYEDFMRKEYYPTQKYIKITPWIFMDENKKLFFWKRDKIAILQLFLKKYRKFSFKRYSKHPNQLSKILNNFSDLTEKEKKLQLEKMQLILKPMNSLEDLKHNLRQAREEFARLNNGYLYGDTLMFCNKKEEFGTIINIFKEESFFAKSLCEKYNIEPYKWERAILYNEEKNLYQVWSLPERCNYWKLEIKFYDKKYLFEYLLNNEIKAIY